VPLQGRRGESNYLLLQPWGFQFKFCTGISVIIAVVRLILYFFCQGRFATVPDKRIPNIGGGCNTPPAKELAIAALGF